MKKVLGGTEPIEEGGGRCVSGSDCHKFPGAEFTMCAQMASSQCRCVRYDYVDGDFVAAESVPDSHCVL